MLALKRGRTFGNNLNVYFRSGTSLRKTSRTKSLEMSKHSREDLDKIYKQFIHEKQQRYLTVKYKNMCQKTLIIDCKRCEKCLGIEDNKKTILCDLCEDAYHLNCLNMESVPEDKFFCENCLTEYPDKIYCIKNFSNQPRKSGIKVSLTFIFNFIIY